MKSFLVAAGTAVTFSLASTAAQAQALPIVGGLTSVTLTAAPVLIGAGLSVGGIGAAMLSPGSTGIPLAYFPVTGGSIDTVTFAGSIEHAGSGLSLASPTTTVSLTDFVINTSTLLLSGSVAVGSMPLGVVPLFNIGLSGSPSSPFSLTVTPTAGAALATVFGIPNLAGAQLGTANTIPITVVPEPATVASMLAGLAMLGLVLARRRRFDQGR